MYALYIYIYIYIFVTGSPQNVFEYFMNVGTYWTFYKYVINGVSVLPLRPFRDGALTVQ